MGSYYDPIADPKHFSFEAQLCITKRAIELSKIREKRLRGRYDVKYLHDPCVAGIRTAEKKIKILENLIALYGSNPGKTDTFIATVYGDRDPYYDTDDCLLLSNEYELGLRPYFCDGQQKYIAMEYSTFNRFYVADGYGKYRYIGREKK